MLEVKTGAILSHYIWDESLNTGQHTGHTRDVIGVYTVHSALVGGDIWSGRLHCYLSLYTLSV